MGDTDYLKPKGMGREAVLGTVGEDSGKFRNPARILNVSGNWPRPQDTRARDYERILGMEKSITGKSPL
jgi:hypothetical protein